MLRTSASSIINISYVRERERQRESSSLNVPLFPFNMEKRVLGNSHRCPAELQL